MGIVPFSTSFRYHIGMPDLAATHSRRHFLSAAGAGFGALALAAIERQGFAAPKMDPLHPLAPRRPDFEPKARSVIFLFLVGGPSQIDTFDYKPELQKLAGKPVPASIRKAVEATRHAN